MSNTARKARKKAGLPAPIKPTKVPTPPAERSFVTAPVPGPGGTKFASYMKPRSTSKVEKYLEQFTPTTE